MDEAIAQFIKRKYNLLVGERTAELIKITLAQRIPVTKCKPWRSKDVIWWPVFRKPWWAIMM